MTERESFQVSEAKERIYNLQGGLCAVCRHPVPFPGQLAHRIPQTKANLKKFGKRVIHHERNMLMVCSLKCNSAVNIGGDPMMTEWLVGNITDSLAVDSTTPRG